MSNPKSWVIKEKQTGTVVMETFNKKVVDILNTQKYESVPIAEHLRSLSAPPGGYFIMIDGEQTCAHRNTLEQARKEGLVLCDAEPIPATFSIHDAQGNHVEQINRTDGRDLSQLIADFARRTA